MRNQKGASPVLPGRSGCVDAGWLRRNGFKMPWQPFNQITTPSPVLWEFLVGGHRNDGCPCPEWSQWRPRAAQGWLRPIHFGSHGPVVALGLRFLGYLSRDAWGAGRLLAPTLPEAGWRGGACRKTPGRAPPLRGAVWAGRVVGSVPSRLLVCLRADPLPCLFSPVSVGLGKAGVPG